MDDKQLIAKAAELLKISEEVATETARRLEDVDALYVYNPIRGGGSLILEDEDSYLFAASSIPFETHLAEFKKGRRQK